MAGPRRHRRPSTSGRKPAQQVTGTARAFIDEALARLFGSTATVDLQERIEQIDLRLKDLAESGGEQSADGLRRAGFEGANLLVERYELTDGVYIAPVRALAWAMDAAHRNGTGASPLLRKAKDWTTRVDTIDEAGHRWIRATSVGACLLLVGDHEYTHDEASKAVGSALLKANYHARTGSAKLHAEEPAPNHYSKVKRWVQRATSTASNNRVDAQDALCNLVILALPLDECRDSIARKRACTPTMLSATVRKTAEAFQVINTSEG